MRKHKMDTATYKKYENCPFCKHKPIGCIGCLEMKRADERKAAKEAEAKEYLDKHLLFSARLDNPEEMATLKDVFHMDALKEHFDGSGISDEDVLIELGGDVERGRRNVQMAASLVSQTRNVSFEDAKRAVIEEARQRIVGERAVGRIKEKLESRGVKS